MIDVLIILSKSLKYTIGKLTEAKRTLFRPLPTSMMNRFLSLVVGFAFTSREYILQHLPMTASET